MILVFVSLRFNIRAAKELSFGRELAFPSIGCISIFVNSFTWEKLLHSGMVGVRDSFHDRATFMSRATFLTLVVMLHFRAKVPLPLYPQPISVPVMKARWI
jgi:hypothetical protein